MTSLMNLDSYSPPIAIPPVPPNFVFCSDAYGTGLTRDKALEAGGQLPRGAMPVTYSVGEPESDALGSNVSLTRPGFHLPFLEFYSGVSISVDVSGPINIEEINVVPNDIRGMAAYIADTCVRRSGVGGFITRKIQGLVDFVTNPTSDIMTPFPDSTAFLTLTLGDDESVHPFPGDFDPQMARFLRRAEIDAFDKVQLEDRPVIAGRIAHFARTEARMRRLGTNVPWWDEYSMRGNRTSTSNLELADRTSKNIATARQKKRVARLLR